MYWEIYEKTQSFNFSILLFTREMVLLLFIFWEFLDSFISTPIGYKDTNLDMKDFSKLSKYCLFNCFNIGSLIGFVTLKFWNCTRAYNFTADEGSCSFISTRNNCWELFLLWCFLQCVLSLLVHIHWQMEYAALFSTYFIHRVIMKKQSRYMRA